MDRDVSVDVSNVEIGSEASLSMFCLDHNHDKVLAIALIRGVPWVSVVG